MCQNNGLPFFLPPLFLRGGAFGNGLIFSGVMINSSLFVEVEATASGNFEYVTVAYVTR